MKIKDLLIEQIEREHEYQKKHEVGSEEYNTSLRRLGDLEDKLADLEKHESEMKDSKKDKIVKNVIEGVKVAGGIVLPIVGFVVITAFEREDSFSTSLKKMVDCFLPRRL